MVPYLISTDQPPLGFRSQKQALNMQFHKAYIKTVGVVYYPLQTKKAGGHVELEVDGRCYTLKPLLYKIQSLQDKINYARTDGFPFFHFQIKVTSQQFDNLKKDGWKERSPICSYAVSKSLLKYADFNIPLPFSLSPLASGIYLKSISKFGVSRIKSIDYYSSKTHRTKSLL